MSRGAEGSRWRPQAEGRRMAEWSLVGAHGIITKAPGAAGIAISTLRFGSYANLREWRNWQTRWT